MENRYFKFRLLSAFMLGIVSLTVVSCKDKIVTKEVLIPITGQLDWTINMHVRNEIGAPKTRPETGIAKMTLKSDNTLTYEAQVDNLTSGDNLTMAHIHAGDPLTNGPIVLDFRPNFKGNKFSGSVRVRNSFADSLRNKAVHLYFNIHSSQLPAGIVRGQINERIVMTDEIILRSENRNPPLDFTTNFTSLAEIRITSDRKLYSRITPQNVDLEKAGDYTQSHIHPGARMEETGLLLFLASDKSEFNIVKVQTISNETFMRLRTTPNFVDTHSSKVQGFATLREQFEPAIIE